MTRRPKSEPKQIKSKRRRVIEWAVQLAVLTAAVVGLSLWQTRHMVDAGTDAPSFALADLDGNPVSLSDTAGTEVVLH